MKPIIIAPIVALALAGAGTGTYFLATGGGEEEEAAVAQPTATPTPSPDATVAPTATPAPTRTPAPPPNDWETYVDPELGFSFPHPKGWTSSTEYYELPETKGNPEVLLRSVTFRDDAGHPTITYAVAPNPAGLTLEDWIASYPGWPSEPGHTTVAGQPALIFEVNQLGERFPGVYFEFEGNVISMSGNVYGAGGDAVPPSLTESEFREVIDRIDLTP
jgi:hypothetical protein